MRVLIVGGGLMGPAAAYNAMADPDVSAVVVCDRSEQQLQACTRKLERAATATKLSTTVLDLADRTATLDLLRGFDVAVGAIPGQASLLAIAAAAEAGTPLVDLALLDDRQLAPLDQAVQAPLIVLGCGLEPGLSEITARYLAEKLDQVAELHIKVGGIPEKPAPPLGYKIVFGGRQMPLYESDALLVEGGQLRPVPRYSGVEAVSFPGVGQCEAWHEGFAPSLLRLAPLKGLRVGTQKTVRWPGYAAKVTLLKDIGLLSLQAVDVDGSQVVPKKLLDAVLYPKVRLEEGERDITVFSVEAVGTRDGRPRTYRIQMVDRYDDATGFTSMARTTAFTGAIVARMIARGELRGSGLVRPEEIVTGVPLARLFAELAAAGIRFELTEERVGPSDGGL